MHSSDPRCSLVGWARNNHNPFDWNILVYLLQMNLYFVHLYICLETCKLHAISVSAHLSKCDRIISLVAHSSMPTHTLSDTSTMWACRMKWLSWFRFSYILRVVILFYSYSVCYNSLSWTESLTFDSIRCTFFLYMIQSIYIIPTIIYAI